MFESINVENLLKCPEGYEITDMLLLSFSLNPKMLENILKISNIAKTYSNNLILEFPKHVLCCIQSDRYTDGGTKSDEFGLTAILIKNKRIIGVRGSDGGFVFHPKLWVFLYRKTGGEEKK